MRQLITTSYNTTTSHKEAGGVREGFGRHKNIWTNIRHRYYPDFSNVSTPRTAQQRGVGAASWIYISPFTGWFICKVWDCLDIDWDCEILPELSGAAHLWTLACHQHSILLGYHHRHHHHLPRHNTNNQPRINHDHTQEDIRVLV